MLRDDLRGVAAGRELLAVIEESRREVGLVLRRAGRGMLNATVVAEGLGLRLLGTIADDPALVVAAERGDPPGRSARSPLAQLCRDLLRELAARAAGRAAAVAGVITDRRSSTSTRSGIGWPGWVGRRPRPTWPPPCATRG